MKFTRISGTRSTFHDDTSTTELEPAVKSERKTRSKRIKENSDDLSVSSFKNKKRNNYVRYPTDDELLGEKATQKDDDIKPSRVLRKTVIKEQNPVENDENLEPPSGSKSLRKSRRGKRIDDAEDNENQENMPVEVIQLPKSKKSKKKNKVTSAIDIDNLPSAEEAPDKKSKKKKKKGKKGNAVVVEDIPQEDRPINATLNKSNMSIDSFYSAASSPDHKHANVNIKQFNGTFKNNEIEENMSASKTKKKVSTNNTIDKNYATLNVSMDIDDEKDTDTLNNGSKKRKSVSKDTTFECYVSLTKDDLAKDLENIRNGSNLPNGPRRSTTKDETIDSSKTIANEMDENYYVSNLSSKQIKRKKCNVNDVTLTENMSADVDATKNNDTFTKDLNKKNSIVKDVTFDKINSSITKDIVQNDEETDLNISNKQSKARQSILKVITLNISGASFVKDNEKDRKSDFKSSNISKKQVSSRKSVAKDTTFDKSNASISNGNNVGKDAEPELNVSNMSNTQVRRTRSSLKDSTFNKSDQVINTTYDKETESIENGSVNKKDSTFDKSNNKIVDVTFDRDIESDSIVTSTAKGKEKECSRNTTYDKIDKANDTTFEKDISTTFDDFEKGAKTRKSSIKDATFDKSNTSLASLTKEDFEKDSDMISSSVMKRKSIRRQTFGNNTIPESIITTLEKSPFTEIEPKIKSPRTSQTTTDIQTKLNTTFEKETIENDDYKLNCEPESSHISSDNSTISDKSDISRISITSDDTPENIVNTTPLLIESSIDESQISKQESPKPQTPLKREGTFTKDAPEVQTETELGTPSKRKLSPIPNAGCTPYHVAKSSQKKILLNVTRSIEKGTRASVDPAPRMTRVMFCSPIDNPVLATQEKRKIIKSNLKGSNKSFVFEDSGKFLFTFICNY